MSDCNFDSKFVVTRKLHRCQMCWSCIPVGENCFFSKGVYDGDFQVSYMHRECYDSWDGEEFCPGDGPVPDRIREYYARKIS